MLAAIGLLLAAPAQAQSMREALEKAWSRHPVAAAASARSAEANARSESASGLTPGPASVSLAQINDRLGARRGRQEWELEVATPLWLPGQRAARQGEAEAAGEERVAQGLALRLELAGELREAWWALAAARQSLEGAERRSATAQALQDDVTRRFRAGELSRVDANLARSEWLSAQDERTDAQLALQQADQAWLRLTGESAPEHLVPEAAPIAEPRLAEHPRLAAHRAAVRLARSRLTLAEQSPRESPELSLHAGRERGNASEPYASSVGVRLTIPLSFGPRVRQERFGAQAELEQAQTSLARLRDQLQIDLARARGEWQAAREQAAAAQQRREIAADSLRLMEKAFSLGEIDLSTLLRIRGGALDAQANERRQLTRRALAESRLRQAAGDLP